METQHPPATKILARARTFGVITEENLRRAIARHTLWLRDQSQGERLDLTGVEIPHCDLSGLDLRQAVFDRCRLQLSRFERSNLAGATFVGADLYGANFAASILLGASFLEAQLMFVTFERAALREAVFFKASGCYVNFDSADLSDADVREVNFTAASFRQAKVAGINLPFEPISLIPVRPVSPISGATTSNPESIIATEGLGAAMAAAVGLRARGVSSSRGGR